MNLKNFQKYINPTFMRKFLKLINLLPMKHDPLFA
jgi:hypothetical protein